MKDLFNELSDQLTEILDEHLTLNQTQRSEIVHDMVDAIDEAKGSAITQLHQLIDDIPCIEHCESDYCECFQCPKNPHGGED
jgi:metal-responsive CopG/Arc/MetJ family transcriptional regulator